MEGYFKLFARQELGFPAQKIDSKKLEKLAKKLDSVSSRPWTIMEVCAGQTRTMLENNLDQLIPSNINLVHGPGCAICATPLNKIDKAIEIAQQEDVIFCCSGELLRLKGSRLDLLEIKAGGADVRVVPSPLDSLALARKHPDKKVVFFTIGFETKAELNALSVWQAKRLGLKNFFLLPSHPLVVSVCSKVLKSLESQVQGILSPGEVCAVTGFSNYERVAKKHNVPIVVSGYEPVDLLEGLLECVKMLESGKASIKNMFRRDVSRDGNKQAKALIGDVFEMVDSEWRGIGLVENGAYALRPEYAQFDADKAFPLEVSSRPDADFCISNQILLGFKKPTDCPAFGKSCRPSDPQGSTMVSNQGTCFTYYKFLHDH